MAEKISKHCWATPKCGISFAKQNFKEVNRNTNYRFIIVRNPYSRLVSFYVNKIIFQADPPWNLRSEYVNEIKIPLIDISDTSISFSQFILELENLNVLKIERHLKPQWMEVENIQFNKIVKLENFNFDIRDVAQNLGLDYEYIINLPKTNEFKKNSDIKELVCDKKSSWFRKHGIPKDWRLFYSSENMKIAFKLYEKDFIIFGYDYN